MKAVILAGGLGTRLQPLTFTIPKPLIPIGETPILEHIVLHLKKYGFREFILSVGYRAELIKTYFNDGSKLGVKISYFEEKKPLGTAGPLVAINDIYPFKKGETFLLMNGDILTKLNFKKFIDEHKKKNCEMTVGIKKFEQKLSFGTVRMQKGEIRDIEEKPVKKYEISAGIYLINEQAVREIPKNKYFTVPELMKKLILKKKKVGGYLIREYWLAVENLQHVEKAVEEVGKWGRK